MLQDEPGFDIERKFINYIIASNTMFRRHTQTDDKKAEVAHILTIRVSNIPGNPGNLLE